MTRIRNDIKVRRVLEKHGIKVISNNRRELDKAGVLVTQYCGKTIVQLNNVVTKEEVVGMLKGLDMEIIVY